MARRGRMIIKYILRLFLICSFCFFFFFFSSRRRHTRSYGDWSSDVCSSDLVRRGKLSSRGFPRLRAPLPHALEVADKKSLLREFHSCLAVRDDFPHD